MHAKAEAKIAKMVRLSPALLETVDNTIKESFNAYVTRLIQQDQMRQAVELHLTREGEGE